MGKKYDEYAEAAKAETAANNAMDGTFTAWQRAQDATDEAQEKWDTFIQDPEG